MVNSPPTVSGVVKIWLTHSRSFHQSYGEVIGNEYIYVGRRAHLRISSRPIFRADHTYRRAADRNGRVKHRKAHGDLRAARPHSRLRRDPPGTGQCVPL